ncbi:hypothetical protein [Clostridium beijerinckii]|nr:hypothetical protein [Clostridium beijerinckii]
MLENYMVMTYDLKYVDKIYTNKRNNEAFALCGCFVYCAEIEVLYRLI